VPGGFCVCGRARPWTKDRSSQAGGDARKKVVFMLPDMDASLWSGTLPIGDKGEGTRGAFA